MALICHKIDFFRKKINKKQSSLLNTKMSKKFTQPCERIMTEGCCLFGSKCQFAHFSDQLCPTECRFGKGCRTGKKCIGIHPSESKADYLRRRHITLQDKVFWKGNDGLKMVENPFCQVCKSLIDGVECPHEHGSEEEGTKCTFAHNAAQLRRRLNGFSQEESWNSLLAEAIEKKQKKEEKARQAAEIVELENEIVKLAVEQVLIDPEALEIVTELSLDSGKGYILDAVQQELAMLSVQQTLTTLSV